MTISTSRTGLCSVTFRDMTPAEVIVAAWDANLKLIEWGSDVHAPPESPDLEDLSDMTVGVGMQTSSYGTYWHAGSSARSEITALVEAAQRLQASRMRIWTAESPGKIDQRIVNDTRAIADQAQSHGIDIALEYHEGTASDSASRVLDLLEAIDRPNVRSYWQPTVGPGTHQQLRDLKQLSGHVAALHVFGLSPAGEVAPLSTQAALWQGALRIAQDAEHQIDLLLEFVPGGSSMSLQTQAAQLALWTQDVQPAPADTTAANPRSMPGRT